MGLITIEFNKQVAIISQNLDGSISLKLEDRSQSPIATPPSVRQYAGGGFDTVNLKHQSRLEEMQDIEDLQRDLFGDD